jgi:hypothetical protein
MEVFFINLIYSYRNCDCLLNDFRGKDASASCDGERVIKAQSILAIREFAHSRKIKCNPFFAVHGHLAAIHGHEQEKKFRDAYHAASQMGSSKETLLPCSCGSNLLLFL